MNGPEQAGQRLEALLATAEVHRTPCGDGSLQWQCWSPPDAGPTLLLLHGGFGSWNHWFANIETLRHRRHLWTVDLPGLGGSADIDASATARDFAAVILDGATLLWGDAREFELAGFSFGAMVGARLALAAGERCLRFTAIGAAGCGSLHVQVPLETPPPPSTAWHDAAPVHRENLRRLMFSAGYCIDDMAVFLHAVNLARFRFNSRRLSLTADFLAALPGIACPAHTLWGSEDATAAGGLEERRRLLTAAGAGFEVLDGIGHWAMYEAPDAVNRVLLVD